MRGRAPFLAFLLSACSSASAEHAPPPANVYGFDDGTTASGDVNPDDQLFSGEQPVGPARDLCGETVEALELVRPNLYFLLDTSGSMDLDMPGSSGDRYSAALDAMLELLKLVGHRVNYGGSVFPASEFDCGPGREVRATEKGDDVSYALSGELGPNLLRFMRSLHRIEPAGATPTSAALAGLEETLADLSGPTYLFLVTDGAPNCNTQSCDISECVPNIESWDYLPGKTCDDGINCCDADVFGASACLDVAPTQSGVEALAELGIETFVIGMPGTDVYADLLDNLAELGRTARDSEPLYYRASDAAELVDTLTELGQEVSLSCDLELVAPPPDPDLVNVFFDDTLVNFDDQDGWTWQSDSHIEFRGEACALLEDAQVLQVQVTFGCPVVVR